ncbi:MAG TPA: DUF6526 family protein [Vicinamibacterales bacterium]|nr:DUF6526 family protein [Vicinamibacterales bacterium]
MADTSGQNYANHRQFVVLYHVVLFGLITVTLIGACVNLAQSWGDHGRIYSASLIVALAVAVLLLFSLTRIFALKVQDRAIRAEEQLRHYVLTGKLLDTRLTVKQIVGLRFASDEELAVLAKRAADQGLTPDAIKREIKNWRADTYRA